MHQNRPNSLERLGDPPMLTRQYVQSDECNNDVMQSDSYDSHRRDLQDGESTQKTTYRQDVHQEEKLERDDRMLRQFFSHNNGMFSQRTEQVSVEAAIGHIRGTTVVPQNSAQHQRRDARYRQSQDDNSRNVSSKLQELVSDQVGSEPTTIGAHLSAGSLILNQGPINEHENTYQVSSIDELKSPDHGPMNEDTRGELDLLLQNARPMQVNSQDALEDPEEVTYLHVVRQNQSQAHVGYSDESNGNHAVNLTHEDESVSTRLKLLGDLPSSSTSDGAGADPGSGGARRSGTVSGPLMNIQDGEQQFPSNNDSLPDISHAIMEVTESGVSSPGNVLSVNQSHAAITRAQQRISAEPAVRKLNSPPMCVQHQIDQTRAGSSNETPMFHKSDSGEEMSNFYAIVSRKSAAADYVEVHDEALYLQSRIRSQNLTTANSASKENHCGSNGNEEPSVRSSQRNGMNFEDFEFLEKIKEQADDEDETNSKPTHSEPQTQRTDGERLSPKQNQYLTRSNQTNSNQQQTTSAMQEGGEYTPAVGHFTHPQMTNGSTRQSEKSRHQNEEPFGLIREYCVPRQVDGVTHAPVNTGEQNTIIVSQGAFSPPQTASPEPMMMPSHLRAASITATGVHRMDANTRNILGTDGGRPNLLAADYLSFGAALKDTSSSRRSPANGLQLNENAWMLMRSKQNSSSGAPISRPMSSDKGEGDEIEDIIKREQTARSHMHDSQRASQSFKPFDQLDSGRREAIMQQAMILANMMYQVTAGTKDASSNKHASTSVKSESRSEITSVHVAPDQHYPNEVTYRQLDQGYDSGHGCNGKDLNLAFLNHGSTILGSAEQPITDFLSQSTTDQKEPQNCSMFALGNPSQQCTYAMPHQTTSSDLRVSSSEAMNFNSSFRSDLRHNKMHGQNYSTLNHQLQNGTIQGTGVARQDENENYCDEIEECHELLRILQDQQSEQPQLDFWQYLRQRLFEGITGLLEFTHKQKSQIDHYSCQIGPIFESYERQKDEIERLLELINENNQRQRVTNDARVDQVEKEKQEMQKAHQKAISQLALKMTDEKQQLEMKMQAALTELRAENEQLKENNRVIKNDFQRRLNSALQEERAVSLHDLENLKSEARSRVYERQQVERELTCEKQAGERLRLKMHDVVKDLQRARQEKEELQTEVDGLRQRFDELVCKETDAQSKLRDALDEVNSLKRELGDRETIETQNDILRSLRGLVRDEGDILSRSAHLVSGEFNMRPPPSTGAKALQDQSQHLTRFQMESASNVNSEPEILEGRRAAHSSQRQLPPKFPQLCNGNLSQSSSLAILRNPQKDSASRVIQRIDSRPSVHFAGDGDFAQGSQKEQELEQQLAAINRGPLPASATPQQVYRLQLNCGSYDVEETAEVKSFSVDDRVVGTFQNGETQDQHFGTAVVDLTNQKDAANVSFRSSAQHRSHWTQQTSTKLELNLFANREGGNNFMKSMEELKQAQVHLKKQIVKRQQELKEAREEIAKEQGISAQLREQLSEVNQQYADLQEQTSAEIAELQERMDLCQREMQEQLGIASKARGEVAQCKADLHCQQTNHKMACEELERQVRFAERQLKVKEEQYAEQEKQNERFQATIIDELLDLNDALHRRKVDKKEAKKSRKHQKRSRDRDRHRERHTPLMDTSSSFIVNGRDAANGSSTLTGSRIPQDRNESRLQSMLAQLQRQFSGEHSHRYKSHRQLQAQSSSRAILVHCSSEQLSSTVTSREHIPLRSKPAPNMLSYQEEERNQEVARVMSRAHSPTDYSSKERHMRSVPVQTYHEPNYNQPPPPVDGRLSSTLTSKGGNGARETGRFVQNSPAEVKRIVSASLSNIQPYMPDTRNNWTHAQLNVRTIPLTDASMQMTESNHHNMSIRNASHFYKKAEEHHHHRESSYGRMRATQAASPTMLSPLAYEKRSRSVGPHPRTLAISHESTMPPSRGDYMRTHQMHENSILSSATMKRQPFTQTMGQMSEPFMPREVKKRHNVGTRILSQERRDMYRSHAASKESSLGAGSRRFLSPEVMQKQRGFSADEPNNSYNKTSVAWLRASQKMTERHPAAWAMQSAKSHGSSVGAMSSDKTGVRKGINMMKLIIEQIDQRSGKAQLKGMHRTALFDQHSDVGSQHALNSTVPLNVSGAPAMDNLHIYEGAHRRGLTATMPYDLGLGIAGGSFEIQQ